ncbi:MAG: nicotinate (nicotinamide) nucleotide adenylyltransferase [Bdellovibrionaceae bacterium]|nr:nicotinate (nicotinamide) nucleotide adenylyltransferase [Pseudobdellovibrionaceae bacterium]
MAQNTVDQRIGIFGGTFNPLHTGHINAIATVRNRLGLDTIVVVPAARNPKKLPVEGPTNEQRLEMLRIGLADMDFVQIDDLELKRGGPSYSIDTLEEYAKRVKADDLYFIIGLDQFEIFDTWKDYERILQIANLVVCSRPGHQLPFSADELPEGVKKHVAAFDRSYVQLESGRGIDFVRLQDVDVSASEVRKRLRSGRSVDRHLTIPVEEYIRGAQLYGPLKDRIGDYEEFTKFCGDKLNARKAINVRGFDLRKIEAPTEFTLIASGTSTRHAQSLAESVVREVKEEYGVLPQSVEGMSEGRWVLVDYGALIVHVFYDYVRQEYRLEDLWKPARVLELPAAPAT